MRFHPQLGHTVVDKTGLTGRYDYTLQWTPDNAPPPMPGNNGGPPRKGNAAMMRLQYRSLRQFRSSLD